MDSSRPFFQIKHGERLGDRLILRFPGKNPNILKMLSSKGVSPPPSNITIGYYLQLEDPDGAWCFMPVNTVAAMTVLTVTMVQNRIMNDLLNRM